MLQRKTFAIRPRHIYISDFLDYCHKFYSRQPDMLSEKGNLPKSVVPDWVRSIVCFMLLKSSLLPLRGSRAVCRKVSGFECNVDISYHSTKISIIVFYNFIKKPLQNKQKNCTTKIFAMIVL